VGDLTGDEVVSALEERGLSAEQALNLKELVERAVRLTAEGRLKDAEAVLNAVEEEFEVKVTLQSSTTGGDSTP
jgi:hypothetical protein